MITPDLAKKFGLVVTERTENSVYVATEQNVRAPFQLDPKQFPRVLRRQLFVYGLAWLGGIGIGLVYAARLLPPETWRGALTSWAMIWLPVLGILLWLRARATRRRYFSYQLRIEGQKVIRSQANTPELVIERHELKALQEIPGKGFVIRTSDSLRFIGVACELDGYEEARAKLAAWRAFDSDSGKLPFLYRHKLVIGLDMVVIVGVLFSNNHAIILSFALFNFAYAGYVISYLLRSPNSDRTARRQIWRVAISGVSVLLLAIVRVLGWVR